MESASLIIFFFFFFNDTATTEIYTLSLHDALPIFTSTCAPATIAPPIAIPVTPSQAIDRKSTRLNSSHTVISYAVFCLKKKKKIYTDEYKNNAQQKQTRSMMCEQNESR